MRESSQKPVLAVDLGGTKILAALVSGDWKLLAEERYLTRSAGEAQEVVDQIIAAIENTLKISGMKLSQLHSISIAAPGPINYEKGTVTASPNIPGWHDIALRSIIKDRFKIKTFIVHDASSAALAEQHLGAGRGIKNLIYITVSTGIGGGIIINGKLYSGASGSAGEVGHMTIDVDGPRCNCGNTGCLEVLASGTAVAREAIKRIRAGEKTSITELVAGRIEDVTAEKVGIAAQNGDALAVEVMAGAANYLGIGLVNLVNIFNPEMIIIGGGMSKLGDRLLEPGRRLVKEKAFSQSADAVRIVTAELGDNVGVLGAAIYARQRKKERGGVE